MIDYIAGYVLIVLALAITFLLGLGCVMVWTLFSEGMDKNEPK